MLRPLLLNRIKIYQPQTQDDILFPDLAMQTNRQAINPLQLLQNLPFIKISRQSYQLRCQFTALQSYSQDRVKFMTKIEVNESKIEQQRNQIEIMKEPIYSSEDIITFLLILRWFPNSMKSHKAVSNRKASFSSSGKDLCRNPIDSADLIQIVFLISQKIYIGEKYADEFIQIISEKNQLQHRQINCMTIILQNQTGKDNFLSTNYSSQSQYHEYLYESNSNRNSRDQKSQKTSSLQNMKIGIKRPSAPTSEKSPRFGDRSMRHSETRSITFEQSSKKRQICCNLGKIKKYFSTIQYVITEVQLKAEMIMHHLNEDKNRINLGFSLQTIKQILGEWPRHNSFSSVYELNRSMIIEGELRKCLSNYKEMLSLELSEIDSITLENIYLIIHQFHSSAVDSFLDSTKSFIHQSNYNECIFQIEAELSTLELELINNYALTKYEYGHRTIKDLEKTKIKKNSVQNYQLMRIIGREEISRLDIGYKMYKQIIESKLGECFHELVENKSELKNRVSFTGNNDEDMLNNIENRIDICQEKRKMLENAIALSAKEAESLHLMIKNMEKRQLEVNSVLSQIIE